MTTATTSPLRVPGPPPAAAAPAALARRLAGGLAWLTSPLLGVEVASVTTATLAAADLLAPPAPGPALAGQGLAMAGLWGLAGLGYLRRRREAADAEAEARLQALVDQLAQQNLALARSNQELENFAYVASHDLQEPLRMVRSYCELLKDTYAGKLGGEGEEFLHFATDGAERMQVLIRDLLTYSRASRNELVLSEVDLGTLLDELKQVLTPALESTHARLIVEAPLPAVPAERNMLGQVLQNLIANAIKFHQPGQSPEVRVSAARENDTWVVAVADNGIGIEPRFQAKIFEMFKRLHTREQYEGTGIGLAVCKKIVERHGGRIWVKSAPGAGAVFRFSLPAAPARPQPAGLPAGAPFAQTTHQKENHP
jgi:light-regulated signal transduction histidine kinase (bacteriophytochrome)